MSSIIERVGQYVTSKGLSMRAFEQSIGASNGAIGRAVSKKTDIGTVWLSKIIDTYPEVNAIWLVTGKGDMLNTPPQPTPAHDEAPIAYKSKEGKASP